MVAVVSCRGGCVVWWSGLHGLMVMLCRSGGRGVGYVTVAVVLCYGGCIAWRLGLHGLTVMAVVVLCHSGCGMVVEAIM